MVESREHLEQPDGQPKKLIAGEAREMRQEFIRRENPVDTYGRSCGSLSIGRTWDIEETRLLERFKKMSPKVGRR